jgi:hypothetical protein
MRPSFGGFLAPRPPAPLVVALASRGVFAMDQSYSVWADLLNKFHTASELIQALWLLVVLLMVVGVTWIVMRGCATSPS